MGFIEELVGDLVLIFVALAFFSIGVVQVINLFGSPFGLQAAFSEGYSMCPAETTGADYLPLGDMHCAYSPGDIVVTFAKWPPDLNSVACASTNFGVVCHRVYSYNSAEDKACFVGDNPKADWRLCFSRDSYVGQVVFKLPRAFGIPGMALVHMVHSTQDFLSSVNAGKYPEVG